MSETDRARELYVRPGMTPILSPEIAASTVDVWLVPKFSMLTVFCFLEPLRVANRFGKPLFAWRLLSSDGRPVTASNGVSLEVDGAIGKLSSADMLAVVSSYEAEAVVTAAHLAWLRRVAARGTLIGGLDTAPFILARAGLLQGYRIALHWESLPAFVEEFPGLDVTSARYAFDGPRWTGSGGAASLDVMLGWIARIYGTELADAIARQLMHRRQPPESSLMESSLQGGYVAKRGPKAIRKALALMEATVADPLPIGELSARIGQSRRQLARLFKRHVEITPQQCYLAVRLDRAQRILADSRVSVTQAALATGFKHVAHFSRAYRRRFDESPRDTARRGNHRAGDAGIA